MMNWDEWLNDAPTRVSDLIMEGPIPLKEYGSDRFNYIDKRHGLMKYKGGNNMKSGMAAVVYFDQAFAMKEVPEVPSSIEKKHSDKRVLEVFQKI